MSLLSKKSTTMSFVMELFHFFFEARGTHNSSIGHAVCLCIIAFDPAFITDHRSSSIRTEGNELSHLSSVINTSFPGNKLCTHFVHVQISMCTVVYSFHSISKPYAYCFNRHTVVFSQEIVKFPNWLPCTNVPFPSTHLIVSHFLSTILESLLLTGCRCSNIQVNP